MSSILSKQRDYKHIAEEYSKVNNLQVEFGKKLLALVGVKKGGKGKVLDMGCGTGEITAFIADLVGTEGQVVGVDPDQERIKVAVQKHCDAKRNITFIAGDSSSHFPHLSKKGHYDTHFSSFVLQWLSAEEKHVFLNTAFKSLKPGGRIAIQTHEKYNEILAEVSELLANDKRPSFHFIEKSVAESLLEKSGFVIVTSKYVTCEYTFPSLDNFLNWYCASDYVDKSEITLHKTFIKKYVNEDGTVGYVDSTIYQIVAQRE